MAKAPQREGAASHEAAPFQRSPEERLVELQISVDRRQLLLVAIVVTQAAWLGLIMLGGWYSGPDIGNLSAAEGRSLDLGYLTDSLGGHFGAPARATYWFLDRVAPLSWGFTVLLRLALQAVATVLLWRLLHGLVGQRRWLPAVVLAYAVSPLLVPGLVVLSSGIGLAVGQVLLLAVLGRHVAYTRYGAVRDAIWLGLLTLLVLAVTDEAVVVLVLLPVISVGFLHQGTLRARLRQARSRWFGWACALSGAVCFGVIYVSGSYNTGGGHAFGLTDAWDVMRTEWYDVLGPALLGGPWRWATNPDEWVAYSSPPAVAQILGQVLLVGGVALSMRRTGRRALFAWALPVVTLLVGALVAGYARSDFLGTFIAPVLRYSYFGALALALGVTLAFLRTPEEEYARALVASKAADPSADYLVTPTDGPEVAAVEEPDRLRGRIPAALVLGGFVAASVTSSALFAVRFWDNPARSFTRTLTASARVAGPQSEAYDSVVPNGVVPPIVRQHFVSDLLALAGAPLTFGGNSPAPLIASSTGQLVPSGFVPAADNRNPKSKECGVLIQGAGTTTLRLPVLRSANDWFVQLQLYQPRGNVLTLEARDASGKVLAIVSGSATIRTTGTLVAVNRRLALGVPATLTLRASDPATNLCLVHSFVGSPFPK